MKDTNLKETITTDFLILNSNLNKSKYNIYFNFNNKKIGSFIRDIDGYYYCKLSRTNFGYLSSHTLKIIADALDKINKPYDDQVKTNLKK